MNRGPLFDENDRDAGNGRREELRQLAAQIRHYEQMYRAGTPEISDATFDDLIERYQELADDLDVAIEERVDARPGADHAEGFPTVEHKVPMLSLEKLSPNRRDGKGRAVPLREQLQAWYDRRLKDLGFGAGEQLELLIEPKIDGISISLLYDRGELVRAVTRGDGTRGDVITAQLRAARAVPVRLIDGNGRLEIRGEVYWPTPAFEAYNDRLQARTGKRLLNPRNGCAGMVKRKEPADLAGTGIRSFLYQVAWAEQIEVPASQLAVLRWLADAGADVYLSEVHRTTSVEEAITYCETYGDRRARLAYEIDGMVIKLDALSSYKRLEGTGHHPHWGIAYKFPPERRATRLRAINVQVGKSGKLTPVAVLDPVHLAGTTVSRASLHNFVELERKDIRVGDLVYVEKAGEIIPQVLGVQLDQRPRGTLPFARPTHCPTCNTAVVSEEIFVYCPNPACEDQVRERLCHFASRHCMDIEGLGNNLVDQLVTRLGVRAPHELFRLTREDLLELELVAEKSAANLLKGIEAAKARGLARVLCGLAIRHVGVRMAEDLAEYFGTADALVAFAARYCSGDARAIAAVAPEKASGAIEGMARKTADSIFSEINSPAIRTVLSGLAEVGVNLSADKPAHARVAGIAGKTFVLSGTLPSLKRSEAAALIKAAGGKVSGSVSSKTNYLVAGAEAGSKLAKANALDVRVIDEATLRKMLEADGALD